MTPAANGVPGLASAQPAFVASTGTIPVPPRLEGGWLRSVQNALLLGLELLDRPDFGFPGAWLRSGQQEVHLIGIDSGPPLKEQHFAFRVDSLDEVRAKLEEAGHKCSKPSEIPGICLQSFTHDPCGNMIEFNQRL